MTYREIIYSILDLSKLLNDDITLNEEHVMFLLDKYRATLLYQKYKSIKLEVPESNYQTLCLDLEKVSVIPGACSNSSYLRSVKKIPDTMNIGTTSVYPYDYFQGVNICLVPKERMRFVGHNEILLNIIYCSIYDNHLYFKSNNPQFIYLKKVKMTGVFEDPSKATELSCKQDGEGCDTFDKEFPLEEDLVTILIDSVVKEIVGAAYRPADTMNTANDELSDLATFIRLNTKSNLQKQMEA